MKNDLSQIDTLETFTDGLRAYTAHVLYHTTVHTTVQTLSFPFDIIVCVAAAAVDAEWYRADYHNS